MKFYRFNQTVGHNMKGTVLLLGYEEYIETVIKLATELFGTMPTHEQVQDAAQVLQEVVMTQNISLVEKR